MPGGAGRPDYDPMPVGGSGANYSHSGTGDGQHVKTKTTFAPKKKTTADGTKQVGAATSTIGWLTNNPIIKGIGTGITLLSNKFNHGGARFLH